MLYLSTQRLNVTTPTTRSNVGVNRHMEGKSKKSKSAWDMRARGKRHALASLEKRMDGGAFTARNR